MRSKEELDTLIRENYPEIDLIGVFDSMEYNNAVNIQISVSFEDLIEVPKWLGHLKDLVDILDVADVYHVQRVYAEEKHIHALIIND